MTIILRLFSILALLTFTAFIVSCKNVKQQHSGLSDMPSTEQLLRLPYTSTLNNKEREYFVYLPRGYEDNPHKTWPVMMFLHGNGERGNGTDELDFVLSHGPLYEAWVYKKDLPFIIISPQLHMFDMDKRNISYIDDRTTDWIPKRQAEGVPERGGLQAPNARMSGDPEKQDMSDMNPGLPEGWNLVEEDLLGMIDTVTQKYNADTNKLYLTGLSYGGFGTWYMASRHPKLFAAIAPVVGWGHPDLMAPIADHQIPLWVFAGGRDTIVQAQYFYAGLNKLETLGHKNIRFTTHEDMAHDTWRRVYNGDDLYKWMLENTLEQ